MANVIISFPDLTCDTKQPSEHYLSSFKKPLFTSSQGHASAPQNLFMYLSKYKNRTNCSFPWHETMRHFEVHVGAYKMFTLSILRLNQGRCQGEEGGGRPPPSSATSHEEGRKDKKINYNLLLSGVFFQAPNAPKLVFGRGSAPDPTGELTTLPRPPSRLGRGTPPPHTLPAADGM